MQPGLTGCCHGYRSCGPVPFGLVQRQKSAATQLNGLATASRSLRPGRNGYLQVPQVCGQRDNHLAAMVTTWQVVDFGGCCTRPKAISS